MNPIYNEYLTFLRDSTGEKLENLQEGYFWLDKSIIKGFDQEGKVHKFYRISIDKAMKPTIKLPRTGYSKLEDVKLASWQDLVSMNEKRLLDLENKSLKLIKEKSIKYSNHIPLVPVSMGKDSMVTCFLVRKCFPQTKAIFNNTTLDCADTYVMAKTFPNCDIMTPKEGFYQYIDRIPVIPSRFNRFCCKIFKVGEMVKQLDHNTPYLMFMGMRNEESNTRSSYGDEWINEAEWGKTAWQGILPIREWSELDVWLYTFWRDIDINPKYKKGYSRVGCHCACPYYTKSTWVLDKYWYPYQRERLEQILKEDFLNNQKWLVMNCTLEEYVNEAWNGGVFRDEPTKEVIEEFAEYNHLDKSNHELVEQYFNKYCANGCMGLLGKKKRIKDKEVLAMNMKLHGREISKFYCKKCLMNMHNIDEERWSEYVNRFKDEGCVLF